MNTPLIIQPPTNLTNGVAQIWVGASGINGGGGTQWGGASVYVSIDNVTYTQVATLTAPLRQGFLSAALPAAAGWDLVDTLSVDLSESGGTLTGTSQAAAQQGATLSLVDSEFMAYETATLYRSQRLQHHRACARARGFSCGRSRDGAPFARLDGAVEQYDLPANFVGQTLYFKFQSFNVFGGGPQDLSTCAVYTFRHFDDFRPDPIFAPTSDRICTRSRSSQCGPNCGRRFRGSRDSANQRTLDLGPVAVVATHPIARPAFERDTSRSRPDNWRSNGFR